MSAKTAYTVTIRSLKSKARLVFFGDDARKGKAHKITGDTVVLEAAGLTASDNIRWLGAHHRLHSEATSFPFLPGPGDTLIAKATSRQGCSTTDTVFFTAHPVPAVFAVADTVVCPLIPVTVPYATRGFKEVSFHPQSIQADNPGEMVFTSPLRLTDTLIATGETTEGCRILIPNNKVTTK